MVAINLSSEIPRTLTAGLCLEPPSFVIMRPVPAARAQTFVMTRVSSDRSSKRTSWMAGMSWVWHLGGLTKTELAKRVWREAQRDDVLDRAAQLSYYFLLSLFPLLIFLSAVLGQVFAGNIEIYYELLNYIGRVMPASAYEVVRTTVDEITAGSSGRKLSIGLLATLWTASAGMNAVIEGLNVAYKVTERRPWWKRRIVAINLTIFVGDDVRSSASDWCSVALG